MSPQEFRDARIELGWSEAELAAIIGVSPREVQRLEADQTPKWRRPVMTQRLRAFLDRHWSPGWLEDRR